MKTLKEIAESSRDPDAFTYAYRNFLDDFYKTPTVQAIEEEPPSLSSRLADSGRADAMLAALAVQLAGQFSLRVPAWVDNPMRFLNKPWFAYNSHEARMFLLVDSPAPFRERNLFVSASVLSRV